MRGKSPKIMKVKVFVLSMALRRIKKALKPLKYHQFLLFLPFSEQHLFSRIPKFLGTQQQGIYH